MEEVPFFQTPPHAAAITSLGREGLLRMLTELYLIRHFELRAEAAYQAGHIGGFFHSYIGQEAIQVAAVAAWGREKNWWTTTYRCHALALLLGATPHEVMAELYGKDTGNAKGRGGSMHLYAERMLGGFGIVGGHLPIATGAAFSLKYQQLEGISICFLGEGAFAQGAIHESLNLASLWALPCLYVIENNGWGMGTAVHNALCSLPIAPHFAPAYRMEGYVVRGSDLLHCYLAFCHIYEKIKVEKRPILIEVVTQRFRGHSISDPGLYRSKEEVEKMKGSEDPLAIFLAHLEETDLFTKEEVARVGEEQKQRVLAAMEYAEKSPLPSPSSLEEEVFAP